MLCYFADWCCFLPFSWQVSDPALMWDWSCCCWQCSETNRRVADFLLTLIACTKARAWREGGTLVSLAGNYRPRTDSLRHSGLTTDSNQPACGLQWRGALTTHGGTSVSVMMWQLLFHSCCITDCKFISKIMHQTQQSALPSWPANATEPKQGQQQPRQNQQQRNQS